MLRALDDKVVSSIKAKYGEDISSLNLSRNGLHRLNNIEKFSGSLARLNLSYNEISDITPLSTLNNMQELSVEENEITSLEALRGMERLSFLDARGNRIKDLDSLQSLTTMIGLKRIMLAGNPITHHDEYPRIVFQLQPNLEYIDDWERISIMGEELNNKGDTPSTGEITATGISSVQNPALSAASAPNAPITTQHVLEDKVQSLEVQLEAMNAAFSLQERALAANGEELATIMNTIRPPGPTGKLPTTADKEIELSPSSGSSEAHLVEEFPYYRLLQLWRKKALDCTIQRTFSDKRLESSITDAKKERKQLLTRMRDSEAQSLVWKQHSAALQEKSDSLLQELHQKQQECSACLSARTQVEQQHERMTRNMQHLGVYLKHLKAAVDSTAVQQTVQVVQAVEKLQVLENRVTSAAERVRFVAGIVAQREVSVRNSKAALEAEKRLIQWSRLSLQAQLTTNQNKNNINNINNSSEAASALGDGGGGGSGGGGESTHNEVATTTATSTAAVESVAYLSDLRIEPEAEALLRSIFRKLDREDSGKVQISHLLACLFEGYMQQRVATSQSTSSSSLPSLKAQELSLFDAEVTHTKVAISWHTQLLTSLQRPSPVVLSTELQSSSAGAGAGAGGSGNLLTPLGTLLCRALGWPVWLRLGTSLLNKMLHQLQQQLSQLQRERQRGRGGPGKSEANTDPTTTTTTTTTTTFVPATSTAATSTASTAASTADGGNGGTRGVDEVLTWGECLLLLVPPVPDTFLVPSPHPTPGEISTTTVDASDSSSASTTVRTNGKDALQSEVSAGSRFKGPDTGGIALQTRSALTVQELEALREAQLLGDVNWGLVPLDLGIATASVTASSTGTSSTLTDPPSSAATSTAVTGIVTVATPGLPPDARLLQRERSYLLRRLQEMTRTLERRAEGIKSYFEAELRREKLKQDRLQLELNDTKNALTVSQNRVTECLTLQNAARERNDANMQARESELALLKKQLSEQQVETVARYEGMVAELTSKISRLESEGSLAQRDCSKREVKCRALQRDILRLQAAQATHTQVVEDLQQQLTAALLAQTQSDQSCQAQEEALRQEQQEKRSLQVACDELKLQLQSTQQQLNDSNTQRRTLETDLEEMRSKLLLAEANAAAAAAAATAVVATKKEEQEEENKENDEEGGGRQKEIMRPERAVSIENGQKEDMQNPVGMERAKAAKAAEVVEEVGSTVVVPSTLPAAPTAAASLRAQMQLFRQEYSSAHYNNNSNNSTNQNKISNNTGPIDAQALLLHPGPSVADALPSSPTSASASSSSRFSQHGVMAAHLSKLVRLAEQAIAPGSI